VFPPESEFVNVARIRKAHGRRGEVAAEILTDFADRFEAGQWLWIAGPQPPQRLLVEHSWFHKGRAILKFEGIEDMTAAESLRGHDLQIPRSERRPTPAGAVYISDLIGCAVLEEGENLGTVEALDGTGGVALLRVVGPEGELLIPFAQEICTGWDMENREVRVRLPEGLRQLRTKQTSARQRMVRRADRQPGLSGRDRLRRTDDD